MHKRNCCDPIAGRLCVAIAEAALGALGSALDATTPERSATPTRSRPFCRPGLDWSERRRHIAGTLGALICNHGLEQRWLLRRAGGRASTSLRRTRAHCAAGSAAPYGGA